MFINGCSDVIGLSLLSDRFDSDDAKVPLFEARLLQDAPRLVQASLQ